MGLSSDLQIEHDFDEYVDSLSGDWDDIPSYDCDDYQISKVSYTQRYNRRKAHTDFYIKAVGVTYGNRQNVIKTLHIGDTLYFVPEENNAYDKNAILIVTESGKDIGYVSKDYNKAILQNIRDGVVYKLTVSNITGTISTNFGVNIKVSILNQSFGTTKETSKVTQSEKITIESEEHCIESPQEIVSKNTSNSRSVLGVAALIGLVVLVFVALLNIFIIPNGKYNDAIELMNEGEYQEAIFIFETIVDYKDSKETIKECHYELGQACVEKGEFRRALTEFSKAQDFKDSKIQYAKILSEISAKDTISTYMNHIVGLKRDGTVIAVGFNEYGACDVQEWTNIESVAAGIWHTIGLKSDGSVVSTGLNENGECNVFFWTDIVSVCAGESHTVGLKSDGTVVATGWNGNGACDVDGWMDIVAISAGRGHTVGLKSDGTVVAVGTNRYGECDVSSWSDIVAISTAANHTVGLKSDGSVVAVGSNMEGACGVDGWTNIVAISAGRGHTVGLKSDGTVVATRYTGDESYYGRCDVENWKGVVAISAGERHTVGLKSDGTIVVAGDLMSNEDFTRFNGIRIPELN